MTLSRQDQIDALSRAMSSMPGMDETKGRTTIAAPARRLWATELVDKFGVSIDPEAATAEAFATNPPQMGNLGPQEVRERTDADEMTAYINQQGPAFLAANKPDLAARLAAAKTQPQRDALIAELKAQILSDPNNLLAGVLQAIKDTDKP